MNVTYVSKFVTLKIIFFPFKALLLYGDFVVVPNFETHATDIVYSIQLMFTAEKVISWQDHFNWLVVWCSIRDGHKAVKAILTSKDFAPASWEIIFVQTNKIYVWMNRSCGTSNWKAHSFWIELEVSVLVSGSSSIESMILIAKVVNSYHSLGGGSKIF